ncbi:hypothetical protein MMC31_000342 [Peltigera leucophlebia]|nr:hypothetical protein [Peltigera leucophlebia]
MAFPFLYLPAKLQIKVVNNISRYADLKALCLVSKSLRKMATPRIYYKVDLRMKDDYGSMNKHINPYNKDNQLKPKIQSLLSKPANLRLVRVLKTGRFGPESTFLMDRLLPLFQKDSMIKFSFSTKSSDCFPTPRQVRFLWNHQNHLQDLKFHSHMIPWLGSFLKERKQSQSVFFKSFTKLDISDSKTNWSTSPTKKNWPLKDFDLCYLQSLSLSGNNGAIGLFAGQSFANLVKLSLIRISFDRTVKLTNVPSLKLLVIDHCTAPNNRLSLPLVFPENFQLQSLRYWSKGRVQLLTHLLAQIKGLKSLIIGIPFHIPNKDLVMTDFINAVKEHIDTLRLFKIEVPLIHYQKAVSALKGDAFFVEGIQTS